MWRPLSRSTMALRYGLLPDGTKPLHESMLTYNQSVLMHRRVYLTTMLQDALKTLSHKMSLKITLLKLQFPGVSDLCVIFNCVSLWRLSRSKYDYVTDLVFRFLVIEFWLVANLPCPRDQPSWPMSNVRDWSAPVNPVSVQPTITSHHVTHRWSHSAIGHAWNIGHAALQ